MSSKLSAEKAKKLTVGLSVAGTLLLLFLVAIIIYQFVCIGIATSQKNDLEQRVEEQIQINQELEEYLEYWGSDAGLDRLARENGAVYPGDVQQ